MDLRRIGLVAACGVLLLGCSDGGSDGGRAGRPVSTTSASSRPESSARSTVAPDGTASETTRPAVPASVSEARDLLRVLAPVVPIPEDVRDCVAEGVAAGWWFQTPIGQMT